MVGASPARRPGWWRASTPATRSRRPPDGPAMDVLVLSYNAGHARLRATTAAHVRFLDASPARHRVLYWNARGGCPGWVRRTRYDAIVLHYSLLAARGASE